MWAPTKWQRMVLLAATATCFANAWRLYSEDNPAGSSFIAGILFLVATLIPPSHGESWAPAIPHLFVRNWKAIIATFVVTAMTSAIFAFWSEQTRQAFEVQLMRVAEAAERERLRTVAASEAKIKTAYELCLRNVAKESTDEIYRFYRRSRCEDVRDRDFTKAREHGLSALEKAIRRDAQAIGNDL